MEDLIGLLIPLLAAAGWLLGMFKKEDSDADKQTTGQESKNPVPRPARVDQEQKKTAGHKAAEKARSGLEDSEEYYKKKKKQIDSLNNRTDNNTSTSISRTEISMGENRRTATDQSEVPKKEPDSISASARGNNLSVQRNLSKKGLAESILMAEVLGPPRSIKPYRSIISERRN